MFALMLENAVKFLLIRQNQVNTSRLYTQSFNQLFKILYVN